MIDTQPTTCNLCGGTVIYCSNARIYGREYGSGFAICASIVGPLSVRISRDPRKRWDC